ncbi:MAG TPA: hypothetical protein VNA20_18475 [Frankiaceae bacterium]|nr:hypothetical protein [Frankiaceae bacterium]
MKVAAVAALLLVAACRQPAIERVPDSSYTGPTTLTTPSATATPRLRSAKPSASCVNGWRQPAPGTVAHDEPLYALRASQRLDAEFHVVDLRRFAGPDRTERWYGQVVYTGKPDFLVRFVAERRGGRTRIVAVADYATTGFTSPDWHGLGTGPKRPIAGLPGTWPTRTFDYVRSGRLPADVRGCLTA